MRANKFVTDLKWSTKKRLKSMRSKAEKIGADWGDTDFFIQGRLDELIANIDEILEEVDGVDARTH